MPQWRLVKINTFHFFLRRRMKKELIRRCCYTNVGFNATEGGVHFRLVQVRWSRSYFALALTLVVYRW